MSVEVEKILECLNEYPICYYKDVTHLKPTIYTNTEEAIGERFLGEMNTSLIVVNENELGDTTPFELLEEIYDSKEDSSGIFSNTYDNTTILAVEGEDSTKLHYISEIPAVAEALKNGIGDTVNGELGEALYYDLVKIENKILDTKNEQETIAEVGEPVETADLAEDTSTLSSPVILLLVISIPIALTLPYLLDLLENIYYYFFPNRVDNNELEENTEEIEPSPVKQGERMYNEEMEELQEHLSFQRELNFKSKSNVYFELEALEADLKEFHKVSQNSTESFRETAMTEYAKLIDSLNRLVSEDYYGDIIFNSYHYKNSRELLIQVEEAISAIRSKLLKDIVQVKSLSAIEFQTDLKLIQAKTESDLADGILYPSTSLSDREKLPVNANSRERKGVRSLFGGLRGDWENFSEEEFVNSDEYVRLLDKWRGGGNK